MYEFVCHRYQPRELNVGGPLLFKPSRCILPRTNELYKRLIKTRKYMKNIEIYYNSIGIPIHRQIHITNTPITASSIMLAGTPAIKNSLALNCRLS